MRTSALAVAAAAFVLLAGLASGQDQPAAQGPLVQSFAFDLTVNPASAAWVDEALKDAKKANAYLVIFRLDTPGGLDDSTREIVKDIIAAPMPVVVYVSPDGARAASAGHVHHRGGGRRGDGAGDEHRLGDADLARRRATRTRSWAARSETTRRHTRARSPRATAATATSPHRWCTRR